MNIRTALEKSGFHNLGTVHHNLTTSTLYEHALFLQEGVLSAHGALVVHTGTHTERAASDKFIVEEPSSKDFIAWGEVNKPLEASKFAALKAHMTAYLQGRDLYAQDCFTGSSPKYRLGLRVLTEHASQSLFVRNMFVAAEAEELKHFEPRFTVVCAPNFQATPELHGTRSGTFVVINFAERMVLIGGTRYAGELKKAVFTLLSFLMPPKKVFPMHCAANVGKSTGDSTLFFGLDGTGKTTLSADPERRLIGDDEHGWADEGVFNFEGGCYAKTLNISPEAESLVVQMTQQFGTLLENVKLDPKTRTIDVADTSLTRNARASYSRERLAAAGDVFVPANKAQHPKHVVLLASDAFGVLPPLAQLTPDQAVFFFLSGYTAQLNEATNELVPVFSACFGEPFMAQKPSVYGKFFRERLRKNRTRVWLLNTGWTGGTQLKGGTRISLAHTRNLLKAALHGTLDNVEFVNEPVFQLSVPKECPNVPTELLQPRSTWKQGNNAKEYDTQAQALFNAFKANIERLAPMLDESLLQSINAVMSEVQAVQAPPNEQAAKEQQHQQKQPSQAPQQNKKHPSKHSRQAPLALEAQQPTISNELDQPKSAQYEGMTKGNAEQVAEYEQQQDFRDQRPQERQQGNRQNNRRGGKRGNNSSNRQQPSPTNARNSGQEQPQEYQEHPTERMETAPEPQQANKQRKTAPRTPRSKRNTNTNNT